MPRDEGDGLVRPGEPALGPLPTSPAGRPRHRGMTSLSHVRSPLVLRLLYGCIGRRWAVAGSAACLRRAGPARAEAALARFEQLAVWSGWPHQAPGWINLDTARFATRVRRRLRPSLAPAVPRSPRSEP